MGASPRPGRHCPADDRPGCASRRRRGGRLLPRQRPVQTSPRRADSTNHQRRDGPVDHPKHGSARHRVDHDDHDDHDGHADGWRRDRDRGRGASRGRRRGRGGSRGRGGGANGVRRGAGDAGRAAPHYSVFSVDLSTPTGNNDDDRHSDDDLRIHDDDNAAGHDDDPAFDHDHVDGDDDHHHADDDDDNNNNNNHHHNDDHHHHDHNNNRTNDDDNNSAEHNDIDNPDLDHNNVNYNDVDRTYDDDDREAGHHHDSAHDHDHVDHDPGRCRWCGPRATRATTVRVRRLQSGRQVLGRRPTPGLGDAGTACPRTWLDRPGPARRRHLDRRPSCWRRQR
jgi:hypothetical protein